jgi:predicted RNA-binding protein YlxR (DUF448 family)
MKPKDELIRIVSADGIAVIDENSKIQARGAYVCKSEKCIALLKKKKGIERSLKSDGADIYEKLLELLKD